MFGPNATLNYASPAPAPSSASALAAEGLPAAAPDGAQQLSMLAGGPAAYQQQPPPHLNSAMPTPMPPEAEQGESWRTRPCTYQKCRIAPWSSIPRLA